MKELLSIVLTVVLLFVYGGMPVLANEPVQTVIEIPVMNESITELDDPALLQYVEESVYAYLDTELAGSDVIVEEVSAVYISKEYLEETSYNSKANIFFGYTLADINATFGGTRYVFTCGENGETVVEEFIEIPDDTYERVIKNVAIGTGVIIVCVVVSIATAGIGTAPAAAGAASVGTKISLMFAASAKTATSFAFSGATVSAATTTVIKGIQTGDFYETASAAALAGSEGFKWGAISGAAVGGVGEAVRVKDAYFFRKGTVQETKYPRGVRMRKGPNGLEYPCFEEYAIKTAVFDSPSAAGVANGTCLSGYYPKDAKLANAMFGYKTTPAGYVWHHVEDMQTMLLVPRDVHSVAFGGIPHKGGASMIRDLLTGA